MIAPSIIERARDITLSEAASLLGLKVPRVGEFVGPCPACGGRDRFSINLRKGVWNCRGARGGNDAISLIAHVRGVDFSGAVEFLTGKRDLHPASRFQRQRPEMDAGEDSRRARNRARELFSECIEPRETVADYYLSHERSLPNAIDDVTALTLRFHPRCPFRDGEVLVRAPALVCALRDPREAMGACTALGDMDAIERRYLLDMSKVVAVQRIRLTQDGRKVERRSLGAMENSVVFVASVWESFYGGQATIGEGVETMAAMRSLGFTACCALTGSGRFRTFDLPYHWGEITISGENDGASESAWRGAGPRWAKAGHSVSIWTPPDPGLKDANDLIRKMAREACVA